MFLSIESVMPAIGIQFTMEGPEIEPEMNGPLRSDSFFRRRVQVTGHIAQKCLRGCQFLAITDTV